MAKQHYVPQLLLRNFAMNSKKKGIYVFDKQKETSYYDGIDRISAEKGFYDLEVDEDLQRIENRVGTVIKKIIDKESLINLADGEKYLLSEFIAIQITRVKHIRTEMLKLIKNQNGKLKIGTTVVELESSLEEIVRIASMMNIGNPAYIPYIHDKLWLLFKTKETCPFYTSDNPITLQCLHPNNFDSSGKYEELGIAVKDIEIYFPISKTLSMGIFSKNNVDNIRNRYRKCKTFKALCRVSTDFIKRVEADKIRYERLMTGLETGQAIPSDNDIVMNINSLQVKSSSRFVYSCTDNFDLVRQMLKENPLFKHGPRMSI